MKLVFIMALIICSIPVAFSSQESIQCTAKMEGIVPGTILIRNTPVVNGNINVSTRDNPIFNRLPFVVSVFKTAQMDKFLLTITSKKSKILSSAEFTDDAILSLNEEVAGGSDIRVDCI
jgi:hypothetical protein